MENKIRVGLVGAKGRMCRAVIETLLKDEVKNQQITLMGGVERENSIVAGKRFEAIPTLSCYGVLSKLWMHENIDQFGKDVDVWVDFSVPKATLYHLETLKKRSDAAYVIGTTGFTDSQFKTIQDCAENFPIAMAGNFSIGINLLLYLLESLLNKNTSGLFDIEVQETHHRMKIDAPSGTAKMILEKIKEIEKTKDSDFIYDRHSLRRQRKTGEVGVTSRRGGGVIGEHEVSLLGDHEILTLKHQAISRSAFAHGVIEAVEFIYHKLQKQEKGLFGIRDILKLN